MSDVKVKRSILQSIIRKSLSEAGGKHGDVSRRLTIGPDLSSLPAELPLSPSDRMSTQLEIERPPVDDPEYMPANTKELGYAVQALAEMVGPDNVEKAYMAFKRIIEQMEEEEDEDEEVQIESMRRKNAILQAILREQSNDDDEAYVARRGDRPISGREIYKAYKGVDLGDDEPGMQASGKAAAGPKYKRAMDNFDLNPMEISRILSLKDDLYIGETDLSAFMTYLSLTDNPDEEIKKEVLGNIERAMSSKSKDIGNRVLAKFIKDFNDENTAGFRKRSMKPGGKMGKKPSMELPSQDEGQWDKMAKEFGYKAASGIRQGVIRDVVALRAPGGHGFLAGPALNNMRKAARRAFTKAVMGNTDTLKRVLGTEYLMALRAGLGKDATPDDREAVFSTRMFRYFQSAIFAGAFKELADYELDSGRTIGDAFAKQGFGEDREDRVTEAEFREIAVLASKDYLSALFDEVIADNASNNFINLIGPAAMNAGEDLEVEKTGAYEEPAFATVKKAAGGRDFSQTLKGLKTPDLDDTESLDESRSVLRSAKKAVTNRISRLQRR